MRNLALYLLLAPAAAASASTVGLYRFDTIADGNDGIGTLYIGAFASCDHAEAPIGAFALPNADFSAETNMVPWEITGLPPGPVHFGLFLDDGTAQLQFATGNFTVAELFDADGTAVIVHALPDNFANIPARYQSTTEGTFGPDSATLATGDAGGRVACGVVAAG